LQLTVGWQAARRRTGRNRRDGSVTRMSPRCGITQGQQTRASQALGGCKDENARYSHGQGAGHRPRTGSASGKSAESKTEWTAISEPSSCVIPQP
jgi:hypothetical protein